MSQQTVLSIAVAILGLSVAIGFGLGLTQTASLIAVLGAGLSIGSLFVKPNTDNQG